MDKGARTVHATLVAVDGHGILITGDAGVGKTTLGVELVKLGAKFIADDAVDVKRDSTSVYGSAVEATRELIAIDGEVRKLTDIVRPECIAESARIELVIDIEDNALRISAVDGHSTIVEIERATPLLTATRVKAAIDAYFYARQT